MSKISIKKLIPYFLLGTLSSVLHYIWKAESIPMTRITDAVFAGCILPLILGIVYYKMKKPNLSWKEPTLVGGLFFAVSMILTVVYFI